MKKKYNFSKGVRGKYAGKVGESNVKLTREVNWRDRLGVAKPVSSAHKPAIGYKCQGCNYRVAYEGDWCGECLCEEDGC
jgi:hypothetical protein